MNAIYRITCLLLAGRVHVCRAALSYCMSGHVVIVTDGVVVDYGWLWHTCRVPPPPAYDALADSPHASATPALPVHDTTMSGTTTWGHDVRHDST